MRTKKYFFLTLILFFFLLPVQAQKKTDRSFVRSGNRSYADSVWNKAEVKYRKAIDLNPASAEAQFNLGNTLYSSLITDTVQGGKPANEILEEIIQLYSGLAQTEADDARKAQIQHNLGNAFYLYGVAQYSNGVENAKETLANSIRAYKESLRLNPSDNETRFNLAKAKAVYNSVPKSPQNPDPEQQRNENDQSDDQSTPPPPVQENNNDISEENAEQILQSLMQDEKELQDKVQMKQEGKKLDKDW